MEPASEGPAPIPSPVRFRDIFALRGPRRPERSKRGRRWRSQRVDRYRVMPVLLRPQGGVMADNRLGVAISGGGHRSALFGLGALMYLVDAGKGRDLTSVASVSGGSLTNAYLGLSADLTTVSSDQMWTISKSFAYQEARRGTLWAAPFTFVYLATIVLVIGAAIWFSFVGMSCITALTWLVAAALKGWAH